MKTRAALVLVLGISLLVGFGTVASAQQEREGHLLIVYDRGEKRSFISKQATIGEALAAQHIEIDARDFVEPSRDEELVAPDYHVNIYRARPVVVVDGAKRIQTVSAHQTPVQIARDVGVTLYPEDLATLRPATDLVADGAGLVLEFTRATSLTLDLYGTKNTVRTQADTVGEMLVEKGIDLAEEGNLSVDSNTKIVQGMTVRIWREGVQTVSANEEISFGNRIVYDADRPYGYRAVQTAGQPGMRQVTYQVEVRGGQEVSRQELASVTLTEPTEQIEVIGLFNDGSGLSKSRGALHRTDSNGVSHRETYYDLPMNIVMGSCGQGGYYTVRPDGAKVDRDGYILVAANYAIYPKCSIVETSMGLGKVYDTGGFVLRHPHGFDLATDWTRADGI